MLRPSLRTSLTIGSLALASSRAGGQLPRPGDTLATVVVTATRVAVSPATPTSSATILKGSELRAAGIVRVADALRLVPGLAVVGSGPVGSQTSLFMRGGNSNYVRVLVDGVAVNDAGGAFDWGSMTTADIDRIEIVRGASSVLYGSDAVTGVIQIFTRDATGASRSHVSAVAGTRGTLGASVGGVASGTYAGFSVDASRDRTSGILAFNNQWVSDVLSSTLRLTPDERTDIRLRGRWTSVDYHYPTDFDGTVSDHNSEQVDHRLALSIDAGRRLTNRTEFRVLLSSNEFLPRSNDGPDTPSDTLGFYGFYSRSTRTRHSAEARFDSWLAPRTVLSVGGEVAHDRERATSVSLSQYGKSNGGFEDSRHNGAVFAQVLADATSLVSWSAGWRLDRNSAFGNFSTLRGSAALRLAPTSRVRLSAGNAFKAPSFFENFATGFVKGNPSLRPESSRSLELGLEETLDGGHLTIGATTFRQSFKDVIDYTGTPPTATSPNYFNVAGADANGWEYEMRWQVSDSLSLSGNWTKTDTKVTHVGFDSTAGATYVDGQRLIRRPADAWSITSERRLPGDGNLRASVTHVGSRDDRDYSAFPTAAVTLPAYTKIDLSMALPISSWTGTVLTIRVDNVLDARFEEVKGYPAPGRLFMIGARIER